MRVKDGNLSHCCTVGFQNMDQLASYYIIACICASSVQSTGGYDDKPYFISTIAGTGIGALKLNVR